MVSSTNEHASLVAGLKHAHDYGAAAHAHEARTRWVVVLTAVMMVGELIVGYATRSLALTADGWHMASHAGALGVSALAYWFARTRAKDETFSFGTGKVHALAGYTSAVALAMVALWMVVESVQRLLQPVTVAFAEALPVAVVGLVVNLASVKLLHSHGHHDDHDHGHDDDHEEHRHGHHADHEEHDHGHDDHAHDHHDGHHGDHDHGDHNLRAAYVHVLADTLTSVLAIGALVGGRYLGWGWLDPAMGLVGGAVIARWSYNLCRGAARQLLDRAPSSDLTLRIRAGLEAAGAEVVDLHVWEMGPKAHACIVSLVAKSPKPVREYREILRAYPHLDHVTIEVHGAPL